MSVALAAAQPVLFVNSAAAPGGDGLSWASAFNDIQAAIESANVSGGTFDEIWVAAGVYKPDAGTNDRTRSFALFDGLALIGGFAGTETMASQRDPATNLAVLDGDIGLAGNPTDNSVHVVTLAKPFTDATLDGFTITNGRADGAMFPANSGGGVFTQGSLTVANCRFVGNFGVDGGGLYSKVGAPMITSCQFQANAASSQGGAALVNGPGTVIGCTFSGNNAPFGAGLSLCCSTSRVASCSFTANHGNLGGGLYIPNGVAVVSRCTFTSNGASRGAGAYVLGSGSSIVASFFGGNSAGRGGALYVGGTAVLADCVVSRNFATEFGGGAFIAGTASVLSTTFVNNAAVTFGGGVFMESGAATAANSIFWSNTDGAGSGQGAQFMHVTGALDFRYCCLQGWPGTLSGPGSHGANPLMVNPFGADGIPGTPDDDVRLMTGSPCIDAGENASLPPDVADLDSDLDAAETLPRDFHDAPRAVNDPYSTDTGAGASPITDMGAAESYPDLPADTTGDGRVDFNDIIEILANWGGPCVPCDANGNGDVDFGDIVEVLGSWGIDLFE